MKSKYILTLIIAGLIASSFMGCGLLRKRVEKTEKVEYKLSAKGKFRLDVDNINGSVEVLPSDDSLGFIYIEAVKTGRVKENEMDKPLDGITIKIDTTDEIIKIETEIQRTHGLFRKDNGGSVDYKIKIPSNLKLLVETVNGSIYVEKLNSDIRLETTNGRINVNKCYGTIDLTSVNGSIKGNIDSTKGIIAETVNGSISFGSLRDASADVDASVVTGKVKFNNLNFTGLTAEKKSLRGVLGKGGAPMRLSTVNGSVTLDGNSISVIKSKDDHFEFKIDFDDEEDVERLRDIMREDRGKDGNTRPIPDSGKAPVTPKADSIKK